MNQEETKPLTAREAALAFIEEKRRLDPDWDYRTDPTYNGPFPAAIQMMSDAEYDRHMERRRLGTNPIEPGEPEPRSQPAVRTALPFGQRLREVRSALGWTQWKLARELGVSERTIIRYEQGRSAPVQTGPLLALRRLESLYAQQLDAQP